MVLEKKRWANISNTYLGTRILFNPFPAIHNNCHLLSLMFFGGLYCKQYEFIGPVKQTISV